MERLSSGEGIEEIDNSLSIMKRIIQIICTEEMANVMKKSVKRSEKLVIIIADNEV